MDQSLQRAAEYQPWVEAMHEALLAHDMQAFGAALKSFNELQDCSVVTSVRKVTGDLKAALEQFRCDSRLLDLAERQVPDARHRLAHVLKLTDDAAHLTMDLVDQSCPLVDTIAHEAQRLQLQLQAKRPLADAEGLRVEVERFLTLSLANMQTLRARLADVLLAQGYQDLSGQIIRSVIKLVDELELALGDLVRIGSFQYAAQASGQASVASSHGPMVPGVEHGQCVAAQQDVDAVLSGLGM
jgi:chemotaxis protein CheZ